MIPGEFRGLRALVTGGTQGIGKAIAMRLGRDGARLYLNYAGNDAAAEETLQEFHRRGYAVETLKADLSDPAAVRHQLETVQAEGPIDILVCNAAYQEKKGLLETDLALMHHTMAVNIYANLLLVQGVARKLIAAQRPGRVLLCSSGHGTLVFEGTFAYDVSKAGLNHFMRSAALELIPYGIRVNAVNIGWTHTPGERRWFTEEEQDRYATTIPIGRAAQPDEIASVAEFLLSDESRYVVGSLYKVDGGFALRPNPST